MYRNPEINIWCNNIVYCVRTRTPVISIYFSYLNLFIVVIIFVVVSLFERSVVFCRRYQDYFRGSCGTFTCKSHIKRARVNENCVQVDFVLHEVARVFIGNADNKTF